MDTMTIALLAGAGVAKSELVDRPREERQRKLAAETLRWSPWTGMTPGAIQEADPFGSAIQGGLAGAMLSQNQQKLDAGTAGADPELSLAGGAGTTAQPQQFPFQMMETQNQSVDPRLMQRPMYSSYR